MTELLNVRNLAVSYHGERGIVRALDGVSLQIGKGEVVGLVAIGLWQSTRRAILPPRARRGQGRRPLLTKPADLVSRDRASAAGASPTSRRIPARSIRCCDRQQCSTSCSGNRRSRQARRGMAGLLSAIIGARAGPCGVLYAQAVQIPIRAERMTAARLSGGQRRASSPALLPRTRADHRRRPTTALASPSGVLRLLHRR